MNEVNIATILTVNIHIYDMMWPKCLSLVYNDCLFKESWLLRGNRSILFLFLSNSHFIPSKESIYLLSFVMAEFVQSALGQGVCAWGCVRGGVCVWGCVVLWLQTQLMMPAHFNLSDRFMYMLDVLMYYFFFIEPWIF